MKTRFWADKTVVVTGGLGFIGSHFVEELLRQGAYVICLYKTPNEDLLKAFAPYNASLRCIQVDLTDSVELQAVFRYAAKKIDAVIHCAALDGNAEFKRKHTAEILDINLRITSNVLNCARDSEVDDLVLLSSAEIYPNGYSQELSEDDDYRKYPWHSDNGYVLSKIMSEMMAQLYKTQYGMAIYIARPTNVYGPRDKYSEEAQRVIPSMIASIRAGNGVEIWGDGSQVRQFVYVKDLVNAVCAMVENRTVTVMNIANNEVVSILELAKLLTQLCKGSGRINIKEDMPTGAKGRILNCEQMYNLIDFHPRTLKAGLTSLMNDNQ